MKDIKYYVFPEKGLTVGILETSVWEIICNKLPKKIGSIPISENEFAYLFAISNHAVTIKAKAFCHGGDEFDEAFGKKLVEAKINLKMNKIAVKQMDRYMDCIYNTLRAVGKVREYHQNKVDKITDDLVNYFEVVMH